MSRCDLLNVCRAPIACTNGFPLCIFSPRSSGPRPNLRRNTMLKRISLVILTAALIAATAVAQNKPLTNEDVIAMFKGGFRGGHYNQRLPVARYEL